jgi:SAM-dependent methyltransferase
MRMTDAKVKALNMKIGVTEPKPAPAGIKIDIGCGTNPTPGYVACDARALKNVAHVFDFGTARWPFKDNTVAEIIMQHSIEHISYRRLPFVLGEARRVLAPGGKLIIRTPDLRFIIDNYLAGKITKEFPPDQQFIAQNFGGDPDNLTPGWWAVLKMFSGQDYPGNEHRFCFDFETLASVLKSQGFPNAKRFTDKPVWSPGEIYCEVLKP